MGFRVKPGMTKEIVRNDERDCPERRKRLSGMTKEIVRNGPGRRQAERFGDSPLVSGAVVSRP